jgi:hypothetical protein
MDKVNKTYDNIILDPATVNKIRELRFVIDNSKEKIGLMLDAVLNQVVPNSGIRWNLTEDSTMIIPDNPISEDVKENTKQV